MTDNGTGSTPKRELARTGVAQDFQRVREVAEDIAGKAAAFRRMAGELEGLLSAYLR
jgi:hypothetical protein